MMSLRKSRMQAHLGMLPHLELVRTINHTSVQALLVTAIQSANQCWMWAAAQDSRKKKKTWYTHCWHIPETMVGTAGSHTPPTAQGRSPGPAPVSQAAGTAHRDSTGFPGCRDSTQGLPGCLHPPCPRTAPLHSCQPRHEQFPPLLLHHTHCQLFVLLQWGKPGSGHGKSYKCVYFNTTLPRFLLHAPPLSLQKAALAEEREVERQSQPGPVAAVSPGVPMSRAMSRSCPERCPLPSAERGARTQRSSELRTLPSAPSSTFPRLQLSEQTSAFHQGWKKPPQNNPPYSNPMFFSLQGD